LTQPSYAFFAIEFLRSFSSNPHQSEVIGIFGERKMDEKKMKQLIATALLALSLSACTSTSNSMEISQLYTGNEGGNWFYYSKACSAALCPPK
jgi:hypothetical protein